jgi:hypothetical protein
MKEKVIWAGQKYEMEWFDLTNISDLNNITQIYGFLFDKTGKLCIVRPTEKRGWRLPGGGIEKGEDWKQALIREADEEADIELDKDSLKLIGYIRVIPLSENCEKGIHYLLRASGKITNINKQTEDIAEGLVNERKFISPEKFLDYCNWGEIGKIQIEKLLKSLSSP